MTFNLYLSPEQSHYELNLVGMWRNLASDRRTLAQASLLSKYAIDNDAPPDPTGAIVPWKVTDAIRDILKQAGFPEWMINIPDSPIRLWAGIATLITDTQLTVDSDFLVQLIRFSELYLGQQLWFDPTAGEEGQWRLIKDAGKPGQTPVFHFKTYAMTAGIPPHLPQGYPIDHGFVTGPLQSYTVPPEYNNVIVITTAEGLIFGSNKKQGSVASTMTNFDSYSPPGSTVPLDPDNPHYLGHEQTYFHIDATLMGAGDNAYEDAQRACDYVALRLQSAKDSAGSCAAVCD